MGLRLQDFECDDCEIRWEDLVEVGDEVSACTECGVLKAPEHFLTATALKSYSMMDAAGRDDCLKKRSVEHTQREIINKTPEKWGNLGINLARHGQIRSCGGLDTPKKATKGGK